MPLKLSNLSISRVKVKERKRLRIPEIGTEILYKWNSVLLSTLQKNNLMALFCGHSMI